MIAPHDFQPSLKNNGFSAQKWGQASLTPKPPRSARTVAGYAVQEHGAIRHDNDDADILLYSVKENPFALTPTPPRTVADDGLHEGEIERLIFAVDRWLRDDATGIFVTLGDRLLDLPGAVMRAEASEFRKAVSKAQKRAGFPAEWIAVFEMCKQERIGVHMHMLLIGSKEIIRQIRGWARFSPYMRQPSQAVKLARDLRGFIDAGGYLLKEAGNPRFAWPEGSGGGDRVIVSTTLRNAMLNEGFPAWQRTTSRDLNRKPPRARVRVKAAPPQDEPSRYQAANLPLLLTVPPSPTTTNVVQLALFDDLPQQRLVPPQELQAFREEQGISQAEIAAVLRISDRSHIANFERGHDSLSLPRLRILRDFMGTYQPRRLAA
jgi:DNA-binding XRE family transcriptional regulator